MNAIPRHLLERLTELFTFGGPPREYTPERREADRELTDRGLIIDQSRITSLGCSLLSQHLQRL